MQELEKTLEKVREYLADDAFPNESAVKQQIIAPVFQGLGWDIIDPNQFRLEYWFPNGKKADFALFVDGKPNIIIEAKVVGKATDAEPQLFQYVWDAGAPFAVLTDGREWRIYLTYFPGGRMDRLVYNLNIQERTPHEAAQTLWRYLSLEEVTSDRAAQNARHDLEEKSNRQEAEQAIPKAWGELINRKESPIITTLLNETASNCGHPPDQDDVRNFLCNLMPVQSLTDRGADISALDPAFFPDGGERARKAGTKSPSKYTYFGKEKIFRHACDAYVDIIQTLAKNDSGFLERFEPECRGRKTHHLVQIDDTSNEYPDSFAKIITGWRLNKSISHKEITKMLKRACKVAGIGFGTDLKISLPNA